MASISRPQKMGIRCSKCSYTVSARSEDLYGKLDYGGACPKCRKIINPMSEGFYYCDNCGKTHELTVLGQFRCSCGWISLIE